MRILLGDIRDPERMVRALREIDLVIHTAALKHVGLGEYNPFEVVRTNLMALQSLLECAIDANIEKFVFTSSDKAVNPTNVMGGSKFIGERLVTAANTYRGRARAVFVSTRFGNVLGSAGSVVPVFRKQIAAGGPLTLTHRGMTRFMMTLREAVDLVLAALVAGLGGEIFVPKMHSLRLLDLADGLAALWAPGRQIAVQETGLRPGEKLYEELISEHELPRCLETEKLLIVLPMLEAASFQAGSRNADELGPGDYPDEPRWAQRVFASQTQEPMSREDALAWLRQALAEDESAQPGTPKA